MDQWYEYQDRQGREIVRPMTAGQAAELGAVLVRDFDPTVRVAGVLTVTFPPEGRFERDFDLLAEVPRGRCQR